jgi:hypothetical protein
MAKIFRIFILKTRGVFIFMKIKAKLILFERQKEFVNFFFLKFCIMPNYILLQILFMYVIKMM